MMAVEVAGDRYLTGSSVNRGLVDLEGVERTAQAARYETKPVVPI